MVTRLVVFLGFGLALLRPGIVFGADGPPAPERTYLQALMGYYSPAGGWKVYAECRQEMQQPLTRTQQEFVKLPVAELHSLATEAKTCRDLYRRLRTADQTMGLTPMAPAVFWSKRKDAEEIVVSHEHAAARWPTYRSNMQRYGMTFKSAQDFLAVTSNEREMLFADSKGTPRTWTQAISRYYSATDGWQTYQSSRIYLEQPVDYSEYEFTHLALAKLDGLARAAKADADAYRKYEAAMEVLGLDAAPPAEFLSLNDANGALVGRAEDAAAKWVVYRPNMTAMGEPLVTAQAFFEMEEDDRRGLFELARGTQRTTLQFLSRNYSARTGWEAYQNALAAMAMPRQFTEIEFRNKPIAEINSLARHAVYSKRLVADFKELCEAAEQPNKYTPAVVYGSRDLATLGREHADLRDQWATRVVYADSCRKVGVKPNWAAFEARPEKEQAEAAVLSSVVARNFQAYATLCDKLEISKDPAFVELSLDSQRARNDHLSQVLWDQRKETITFYAKRTGEVATALALAYLAYRAYESSSSGAADPAGLARRPSQIDRNAFNRQRADYWKDQARSQPNRYGSDSSNLQRMMSGRAPMGADGFPMELHHPGGNPNATLVPMTRTEHRIGDNYMKNHPWMFQTKP